MKPIPFLLLLSVAAFAQTAGYDPLLRHLSMPPGRASGGGGAITVTVASGDPNQTAVACSAFSSSSISLYQNTADSSIWLCDGSKWLVLPTSIGSGPYSLSALAGTVTSDVAANRGTCTVNTIFYATDTHVLSQCSAVTGNWTTLNGSGYIALIFDSATHTIHTYDENGVQNIPTLGGTNSWSGSNTFTAGNSLSTSSQTISIANAASTGTTVKLLAKLTGAPSTAVKAATTDTSGIIGIVVSGAGTTGSAEIARAGQATCTFDGATTAGHYVQISSSTAGQCHDAGATYPTSGQILGIVTQTIGATGDANVLIRPDIQASSGTGTHSVGAVFNGGGQALTSGTTVGSSLLYTSPLPFGCTVTAWTVTVDTGTAGFRVWRAAAGTAVPTIANTLNGGDLAISTGTNLRSTTMTNFTGGTAPTLTAGDILAFQLNAVASSPTYVAVSLQCQ